MQKYRKEKSFQHIQLTISDSLATVMERETVLNLPFGIFAHLQRGFRVSYIFSYAKRKFNTNCVSVQRHKTTN